jgi:lipoprotein-anchoring transpeptidase ErfK/SrfK
MWQWKIKEGELWRLDDRPHLEARGYSGAPGFKNDPAATARKEEGPIPVGTYTIGAPHDTETHGPYVLPLTPDVGNKMYGRSAFLIHGDSIKAPGTASHGCIILPRSSRERIGTSGDHCLQVV